MGFTREVNTVLRLKVWKSTDCFQNIPRDAEEEFLLLLMKLFKHDELKLLIVELCTLEYTNNRITERHIIQYTEI